MGSRIWRTIGVALAVLALLEGTLHFSGRRIGATEEWYVAGVGYLVEAMDVIEEAGVSSDVAIAGTSLVMLGIRTSILEDALDSVEVAHNVGLPDAHPPIQRRWLLEQAIPRLKPERVVWGVASLSFNGGRPQKSIDLYEHARAGKAGFFGPIDRALASVSMIARYRELLRGPLFVLHLFDPVLPEADPAQQPLDTLMKSVFPWPNIEKSQERFEALRSSLVSDFHVGEREAEDFIFTIEAMQDMDIEVVVVLMPVPLEYVEAHEDGRESFESWVEWVKATGSELGVPLFDYSRAIPDDQFADYNHVDPEGADVLTEMLVEDLRGLGW